MKNALHKIGIISILAFALAACRFSGAQAVKERLAPSPNPSEETEMVKKVHKTEEGWKAILTPEQYRVLRKAGTERPFTGKYNDHYEDGLYVCAACGTPLFSSKTKYDHGTGWPSFTAPVATENVEFRNDLSHGMFRTEVRCAACGSHLGHVFEDGPPPTRLHFCINSVALDFKPVEARPGSGDATPTSPKDEKSPVAAATAGPELMRGAAISGRAGCGLPSSGNENPAAPERKERLAVATFAAGCFWGVEDKFRKVQGVISTRVGYTGGTLKNPTYRQVCSDKTGHAEAVEIVFDPAVVSYDTLLELFFRFHDPTQVNRQGPDVGTQYRSAIFYHDEVQREAALKMIRELNSSGKFKRPIATQVVPAAEFYRAEDYHQQYYEKLRRGR